MVPNNNSTTTATASNSPLVAPGAEEHLRYPQNTQGCSQRRTDLPAPSLGALSLVQTPPGTTSLYQPIGSIAQQPQHRVPCVLLFFLEKPQKTHREKQTKLGLPLASPPFSSHHNQALFILQQTGGESQEILSADSLSSRQALVFDMSVSKREL